VSIRPLTDPVEYHAHRRLPAPDLPYYYKQEQFNGRAVNTRLALGPKDAATVLKLCGDRVQAEGNSESIPPSQILGGPGQRLQR